MKRSEVFFVLFLLFEGLMKETKGQAVEHIEESLNIACSWIIHNYTREGITGNDCTFPTSGCEFDATFGKCFKGLGSELACGCDTNSSSVNFTTIVMMASESSMLNDKFSESVCRTKGFEDSIFLAQSKWPVLDNFYAGWTSGLTLSWPAYSWAKQEISGKPNCYKTGYCQDYDPRRRPWYGLASAGTLDVVILIDTTSLMRESSRLVKAKGAAKALLGAISSGMSYSQVISFGSAAKPTQSENSLLIQTDEMGMTSLQAFVESLASESVSYSSNISGAFSDAFTTLIKSRTTAMPRSTSNCRSAIVCLSANTETNLEAEIEGYKKQWISERNI